MGNCLAGCISNYKCGEINVPGPAGKQGDSFAPFVKVTFVGGGTTITVGNESVPPKNTAVIKSFDIGFSDGYQANIEITDQEGGNFPHFVDNLLKCVKQATVPATKSIVEWGWVVTTCEGSNYTINSPKCELPTMQMEVSNSEGRIRYKFTCTALGNVFYDMREDRTWGEDGSPMKLEDAIKQLCAEPPAINVRFCKKTKSGNRVCDGIDWKGFGKGGPKCVWTGDSSNRLSTISRWVEPFQTNEDKGIFMFMSAVEKDTLIIMQDVLPNPNESITCNNSLFGTFIYNGGSCSNVIEFNPTYSWVGAFGNMSSGGQSGAAADGGVEHQEDTKSEPEKKQGKNTGLQQTSTISRPAWDCHGPKNATKETAKAQKAHLKANRLTANIAPIKADMRILGDPRIQYVDQATWIGQTIALVAINPFSILETDSECGDWLASPVCNEVTSNRGWIIQKISHSIKEGSYTTNLSLLLPGGEIELNGNEPIGGQGSLGYTPRNACE